MRPDALVAELTLPFLAQRAYLHGTTLFDALQELLPPGSRQTYKFSRMIRSDRVAVVADAAGDEAYATLAYDGPGGAGALGVVPLAPTGEPERRRYDEPLVVEPAAFEPGRVRLDGPSPFSFVATAVPLHKALLAREVEPPCPGQWVFTRLDLERAPAAATPIELACERAVGGRIARSRVAVAGEPVGAITFSWLPRT
jgi:hypothetical protein